MKDRVLIVGVSDSVYGQIAPVLENVDFEVDRLAKASSAMDLVSKVQLDVLIVGFPPSDTTMQSFLDHVRGSESPCLKSPLLLISPSEAMEDARKYIGKGANRVLSDREDTGILQGAVIDLLQIAPRISHCLMLRLSAMVDGKKSFILCQTVNFSSTGVLIRTGRRFPVGTDTRFDFMIPDSTQPIRGSAEVVRHTLVGREKVTGMGLTFRAFDGDSRERLETFLDKKLVL